MPFDDASAAKLLGVPKTSGGGQTQPLMSSVTSLARPRRPCETIRAAMQAGMTDPTWTELFFGTVYLAAGRVTD